MDDLSAIQRDILVMTQALGGASGVEIYEELNTKLLFEVNEGRFYANLNKLSNMGMIVKERVDGRENKYRAAKRGRRAMHNYFDWVSDSLEFVDVGPTPIET
jgi:DNA-binding PadR family transcriptional regulator